MGAWYAELKPAIVVYPSGQRALRKFGASIEKRVQLPFPLLLPTHNHFFPRVPLM